MKWIELLDKYMLIYIININLFWMEYIKEKTLMINNYY